MKNIIVLLLFVLSATLSGCGNDQYAIEKQYYQAQKQAQKIFKNPYASPPNELERVVNILSKFAQKHPQTNLAVNAEFNIAQLYIVKEEYDKARRQIQKILDKYSKSEGACSEALFLKGNSYEIQDKWDLALGQYKKVMQDYPVTLRGLDIPIYIAQYYKVKYQPDKMVVSLQEAVAHYQALATKYPKSPLAYQSHMLLAQCYIELKDWQNAVSTFSSIADTYKDKVNADGVLLNMALIYNRELKSKVKAKEALKRLIKEYPRSSLIKTATNLLKELEKNE